MGYVLTFATGVVLGIVLMRHWFFVYIDMHPSLRQAYDALAKKTPPDSSSD